MKIHWTPWFNVPLHRRMEVFGVICIFLYVALGPISTILIIYSLIAGNIYWKLVSAAYVIFFIYDLNCAERGGRGYGSTWVRSWSVWKHAKNYFPVDMVKTAELPPDRNYLICFFPHGLISLGAAANMCSSHSKWAEFFPGTRPKLATLAGNSYVPVAREIALCLGHCSASANSLTTLLNQSNDANDKSNRDGYTSNAVGLVVGGVREQRFTFPNRYTFVVAKRRGFARIALQTGCPLVPAISFGENDQYDIIDLRTGWLSRFTRNLENLPPFYYGRGLLQYNFGILPRRRTITTVIGAPIHLGKIPNPTEDDLDKAHKLFCTRLTELFEKHKHKYIENAEDNHIIFV